MSIAALGALANFANMTIKNRGRVNIALSGGGSPLGLYSLMSKPGNRNLLPWERVHFYWVDERFVPHSDRESNFGMALETFIDAIDIPEANLHPIDTCFASPAKAAANYRETLKIHFGANIPVFDLILLGMGPDGHTASLFPFSPALNEQKLAVIDVSAPVTIAPHVPRITMTFPVLNRARKICVIAAGAEKQHVLDYVLSTENNEIKYPVQMLEYPNVAWYISKQ